MGEEAPAEHIIASIVAGAGAYTLPLLVPFIHRFGRRTIVRATLLCTMATAVAIAAFSVRSPFDEMHQKRVFVIHMENVSGASTSLPPTICRLNFACYSRSRRKSSICMLPLPTAHRVSSSLHSE